MANDVFIFCCDTTSTSVISGIFILHQSVNIDNIGVHLRDDVNIDVHYNHDIASAVYIHNNINIAIDCTTVDITNQSIKCKTAEGSDLSYYNSSKERFACLLFDIRLAFKQRSSKGGIF